MSKTLTLLFSILIGLNITSCRTTKITKKQNYMNSLYNELKDTFPDANVIIKNDSIKLYFSNNILFETGSTVIKSEFNELLLSMSNALKKFNKTNLLIIGHTDSVGELGFNETLSKSRANSVKSWLIINQIDSNRVKTWGMANKEPIDTNNTAEGRTKNRRVEFIILYKEERN